MVKTLKYYLHFEKIFFQTSIMKFIKLIEILEVQELIHQSQKLNNASCMGND
jgi:hypothetical protein